MKGGIYAPGKVTRVSGASFVWLCSLGQGRGVRRCSSVYSVAVWDGSGMYGMADNFIRSNKEPDNYEGNTFLLALTVMEPYKGESQLCCPHVLR